jgi:S1-C subfamily serine protease
MRKPAYALLLLSIVLVASTVSSSGGKLYKWVDEKGVIHFSDRKPEGSEKITGVLEERDIEEPSRTDPPPRPEKAGGPTSPIEHAVNCTFTIRSTGKIGTGFLLTSTGLAATCRHVVEEMHSPTAVLHDQSEFPLHVIATSQKHDLALVQVLGPANLPFLSMRDAETMAPGDRLFAIGTSVGLQSTITDGVFTGLRKIGRAEQRWIQFSAPVNHGNSGGPLLDLQGQVIGVVSLKVLLTNGTPVAGVGFAVPSASFLEEFRYMIQ